jgi:hypothetical protein
MSQPKSKRFSRDHVKLTRSIKVLTISSDIHP